ncbi:type VI secretion system Vgr family protein, partial [Ideonella sp.]|uniref:type VI secretion system Vgr family protein n=1 Tax=Ideonella sp. TaxID=1929293 RepID=UPI0037C18B23
QLPQWLPPELRQQAHERGYANQFEASRIAIPWRPQLQDGSGARLNPRHTGPGLMTATVVGPDGHTQASGADELHMDALGRVRIQFPFQRHAAQSGSALPNTSASSTWVRVAQSAAGPGMGTQFIPRIGQEVIVTFLDNDIDRPVITGTLYNGQGEGGNAPSPGGVNQDSDTTVFAHSSDHQPSAQGNLMGAGHSPAWHGASPHSHTAGGQANPAALSGFKTKEFGGQGFNQLVFDDTPSQLRTQLATSQHASQLNLGHLVHQADNHRGSFRGLGFELRTDAYGAIRAGQGVLISSYGLPEQEPAGDNVAGQALAKQLQALGQSFSQAAATHQAVKLAGHEGTSGQHKSSLSPEHAPFNALYTALSGLVGQSWEQAQGDAASIKGATDKAQALPHATAPVIAISARAGLIQTAGQDLHTAAAETLTLAAGQHSSAATGGALRIHSGQAIGMLGGAIKPGTEAAGTGLSLIAAQGNLSLQAQASTLQVAAKGRINIQSANSHIDWAAAKKISLTTAGGANITLEGGNITVQCPGTITVKASVRKFGGPSQVRYPLDPMTKHDFCLPCFFRAAMSGAALVPV